MKQGEKESFGRVQARHYRRCLKEAKLAAAIFLLAFLYCVAVIAAWGYPDPGERSPEPALVWGIPEWVVWGLFVPWLAMLGVTWWFALFVLRDDEPHLPMPDRRADDSEADP